MIYIREKSKRGYADHVWLQTWHTFSFADYYDPNFMGFSVLRVINEDTVKSGEGFGTHPHKDMEILTYVMKGTVEHKDSMGNTERVTAGEFQVMSAGTGVMHSEYSVNPDSEAHFYQIWILPERTGITPRYVQRTFDAANGKQLVLSPDESQGSLKVYQDMKLWRWALAKGQHETYDNGDNRKIWIQVVRGEVSINGKTASASDGVAIWDEAEFTLEAAQDSEILLFDMPNK
jgi:redox-sensitive bicupin YhaK (pirin superfamily)